MFRDADGRTAPRKRRASDPLLFPPPNADATTKTDAFPLVTLKATTAEDATAAGFAIKGSLTTCLAETLRLQAWAQRFPHEFEYALRVGKTRRIVTRAEDLTQILEELYRASSGTAAVRAKASLRTLPL